MNITPWTVYFWQQADAFIGCFQFLAGASFFVAGIAAFILTIGWDDWSDDATTALKRAIRYSLLVGAISGSCTAFIPRSNTIAMMYVLPEIANSKVVQQDLPEIYDAAMKALKEQLKP